MALSGVHVACGFIGADGQGRVTQSLARVPVWSETLASAGTTAQSAPAYNGSLGAPSFEIRASADCYVAIGPVPVANVAVSTNANNARVFVPAGETRNIFCNQGDKLAWVAA